jgi:hypothetical protein
MFLFCPRRGPDWSSETSKKFLCLRQEVPFTSSAVSRVRHLLRRIFIKGDCSAPEIQCRCGTLIIIINSSSVVVGVILRGGGGLEVSSFILVVVVVIVRGGGEAVVVVHVVVGCKMSKAVLRHWLYKSGGGGDGSIMQSCLWRS